MVSTNEGSPHRVERTPALLANMKPAVDARAVEVVAQVRPLLGAGNGLGPENGEARPPLLHALGDEHAQFDLG